MNSNSNSDLSQTISNIFANNDISLEYELKLRRIKQSRPRKKQDLELALAVILVDLASCDQKFQPDEYQAIVNGLRRVFGSDRSSVSALVNRSKLALANLRGSGDFSSMLRDNLNEAEKQLVMEIIDELILADGKIDGFERYFRTRYAQALGVDVPELSSE
ncbi:MAG: TerB family tellurite resistance protein [Bdellovibrionales bacterium]|nr:TerB family tellurite resistance protein [Bdellovibrionales bacterium]